MSHTIELNAELRLDVGKGASRRLRRLDKKVPAIIYGGHEKDVAPVYITFRDNELRKVMQHESFYTSVLHIHVENKAHTVIVKDIQRHPYKVEILHVDLLRVAVGDTIAKKVPLHFVKSEKSDAVKHGALVSHILAEVEVECQVKDLPEFIEVDLSGLQLEHAIHLSDLVLPKGVKLAADVSDELHNLAVANAHMPRAQEVEDAPVVAAEVPTVADTKAPKA